MYTEHCECEIFKRITQLHRCMYWIRILPIGINRFDVAHKTGFFSVM